MSTEYDTTPTADPGIEAREAHWDRRANGFDTDFTQAPVREQVLDQISRQLPTEPCTALDAGIGSGRTMARLIQGLHPESDIVGCTSHQRCCTKPGSTHPTKRAGRSRSSTPTYVPCRSMTAGSTWSC